MVPAATAIITALDQADHLVGVTRFCAAPDAVPVVGDIRPSPARVMAQQPDLVVMGDFPSQADTRRALEDLDLNVLALPMNSLADVRSAIVQLGARLLPEAARMTLVDRFDAGIAAAVAAAANRAPLKTLLVFDLQPGYVFTTGGGDHLAEMLALVKAPNVADGGPLTTRLALARVVALAPEVIIHVAPSQRFPDDAAARAWWKRLPDLPAVAHDRVYVWPDDTLAQTGPHVPEALERLGTLLDRATAAGGE